MRPTTLANHLLHPSGGLIWHWRAWLNRHHWSPLTTALRDWIRDWIAQIPPEQRSLILIGPSAGWTLPLDLFGRFDTITVFEPDIMARQLLRYRLTGTSLFFESRDVFSEGGLHYLQTHYPHHAILFCNVLGQLAPEDEEQAQSWCGQLRTSLRHHTWASYHDLISTHLPPTHFERVVNFAANTSFDTVLKHFWRVNEIEICDHHTFELTKDVRFACIPWRLRKNQWHLLQWVTHFAG